MKQETWSLIIVFSFNDKMQSTSISINMLEKYYPKTYPFEQIAVVFFFFNLMIHQKKKKKNWTRCNIN